jgi:hypothetical protein
MFELELGRDRFRLVLFAFLQYSNKCLSDEFPDLALDERDLGQKWSKANLAHKEVGTPSMRTQRDRRAILKLDNAGGINGNAR